MTKYKRKKPASQAQKDARERNWNKGQIMCLRAQAFRIYKCKTTKNKEKLLLNAMMGNLDTIIRNWKIKE